MQKLYIKVSIQRYRAQTRNLAIWEMGPVKSQPNLSIHIVYSLNAFYHMKNLVCKFFTVFIFCGSLILWVYFILYFNLPLIMCM